MIPFQRHLLPQRWHAITSIEYRPEANPLLWDQRLALDITTSYLYPAYPADDPLWSRFSSAVESIRDLERVIITDADLGLGLRFVDKLLAIRRSLKMYDVYLKESQQLSNEFRTELENARLKLVLPSGRTFTHHPWVDSCARQGTAAYAAEL